MKKKLLTAIFSLGSMGLFAQEEYLRDVSATQNLSKTIASLFQENQIATAFGRLTPYWPMPQNEMEAIEEKTIKYLNLLEQRFGKAIGFVKIKNETISDIAIRETYLVRYTNSAIRLKFTFYKNDRGWIVNAFNWDDSFTDEFE
ncbi:hypothetical protein D1013_05625 [Euzebyella marina]|uniref:DUF3887 domain-containing protein n=1 Tax=Euzebyella marina TaxID=1761453 RepID=A0A3G2L3Q8_9FLAO|nr:hypothetical protein [Euzebyella marina]AYN66889.1 hypothetical protein D1013_05625 [Euzebyella marina]